jgi:hypothetical protein
VEEGEGSWCAGDPNEREREKRRGHMGGVGARGAGPSRAGLGWVGLGWAEPLRGSKPTTCTTTKRN